MLFAGGILLIERCFVLN